MTAVVHEALEIAIRDLVGINPMIRELHGRQMFEAGDETMEAVRRDAIRTMPAGPVPQGAASLKLKRGRPAESRGRHPRRYAVSGDFRSPVRATPKAHAAFFIGVRPSCLPRLVRSAVQAVRNVCASEGTDQITAIRETAQNCSASIGSSGMYNSASSARSVRLLELVITSGPDNLRAAPAHVPGARQRSAEPTRRPRRL